MQQMVENTYSDIYSGQEKFWDIWNEANQYLVSTHKKYEYCYTKWTNGTIDLQC